MITIEEIKKEIQSLEKKHEDLPIGLQTKQSKSDGKKAVILRRAMHYLETNPKKPFLENTLNGLIEKLDVINDNFYEWIKNTPGAKGLKNPEQSYQSEMGVKNIKNQIESLKFILK